MTQFASSLRDFPRNRPGIALVSTIVAVELLGASGSLFTVQALNGWYPALQQPAIAPPNWVFGPVWTLLFALIGVAVWLVWRQAESAPEAVRFAGGLFLVHFVVNIGWSAVFFGLRNISLGLVVIGLLWVLIVATMWAFYRIDRRAGGLLVPYLLWVSFAAVLNYRFWVLN